jgi:hypothetical protein
MLNRRHLPLFFLFLFPSFILNAFTNAAGSDLVLTIRSNLDPVWSLWDACDTHQWAKEDWGGTVDVSWGNYFGRDCLKAVMHGTWGVLRTDQVFADENWNNPVTGLRLDLLSGTNAAGVQVKLEVQNHNLTTISNNHFTSSNPAYHQWKEMGWDFSGTNYKRASKLMIIFSGLQASMLPYTFYLDNIRLVSNNRQVSWDVMDIPRDWRYALDSDAVTNVNSNVPGSALIPVSHFQAVTNSSAGAIFMQWNAARTAAQYAKVSAGNLNNGTGEDWSVYSYIRAQIISSSTNGIRMGFWDSHAGNGIETESIRVSLTDHSEILSWNLPKGSFNWASVDAVYFVIKTDQGISGWLSIDDIRRGR